MRHRSPTRRAFLVGALLAVGLSTTAASCPKPPPSMTPEAAVLWKSNEIVVAIGTLQHAAIGLNAIQVCPMPAACRPLLSTANTQIVKDAATDAITTVNAVPSGWQATALAALARIETRLDAAGALNLKPYIDAARTIITGQ